jgi:hypothetical protein
MAPDGKCWLRITWLFQTLAAWFVELARGPSTRSRAVVVLFNDVIHGQHFAARFFSTG